METPRKRLEVFTVKRKALLPLALILCILMGSVALAAEDTVIYNGIITRRYPNSYTNIYKEMDTESEILTTKNAGNRIQILAVYPNWVAIQYGAKGVAYVLRHRIDVTQNLDPKHVPDYPVTPQSYYAVIDRTVEVKAEKNTESETLSTLTEGAKIAIMGMEDGWAVVIHKREYGYINSNDLNEIYPVAPDIEAADSQTPLSVFTSFYSDNPDRIINLGICCDFISKVMQPGEVMDFNATVGPFSAETGYMPAPVLVDDGVKTGYGGGSCQVSSTLWDALMQLPGITILKRNPHGNNAASYLPHGMDAASGTATQNFIFRNDFDFPIRIEASTHDLAMFVAIYKEI